MKMPFDNEQPAVAELPLEAIRIEGRFRRELGDIDSLAFSIAGVGLLHPIVVTPDYRLIAGARRLHAMRRLGRTHVPAHVVPLADIVRGEFDENTVRADFLPSEMVAIKRALEDEERRQARERQGTRTDKHPGKLPESSKGRVNDMIAKAAGVGRRTLEKAEAVVAAAEREPEFAALVEKMDRTRRVNGVYRKLVVAEKAAAIRNEAPPLPARALIASSSPIRPGRTRNGRSIQRSSAPARIRRWTPPRSARLAWPL
jgi:ParB-like chromosome segregation protein Spo0J